MYMMRYIIAKTLQANSEVSKTVGKETRSLVACGWGRGLTMKAEGTGFSLHRWWSALIRIPWTAYLKGGNFIICKLYLNIPEVSAF
jgi:hypothetical protein